MSNFLRREGIIAHQQGTSSEISLARNNALETHAQLDALASNTSIDEIEARLARLEGGDRAEHGEPVQFDSFQFANICIPRQQLLHTSTHAVALQQLNPVGPNHIVIVPRRAVPRLCDLTVQEYTGLWQCVREAQAIAEVSRGATASNIAVKDGDETGRAVPTCHIHVVPRVENDELTDDRVFEALEKWAVGDFTARKAQVDWPSEEQRAARTPADMAAEASQYRDTAHGLELAGSAPFPEHTFYKFPIAQDNVFYHSALSVAFVNLKPLLPGHVLVTSRRCVRRVEDLTSDELDDLMLSVKNVQRIVEEHYGAHATEIGIQDGREAGQSVPHVHVHLIPFKETSKA